MRISKDPEVRRGEIMDTAEDLFSTKGYNETTIMDILNAVRVAKGTFYYYFKSKEEVLDAIIDRILDEDVAAAKIIADDPGLSVFDKLYQVLIGQRTKAGKEKERMMRHIHRPSNAQMHQKALVQSVLRMTPILTRIVEQGVREGVMRSEYPGETMEFLVAAGQTIFDEGLFRWEPEISQKKAKAFIRLMGLALGASKDNFDFMAEIVTGKADLE